MRKVIFLFIALTAGLACYAQIKVQHLLTENQVDPINIDAPAPRFSWQLSAANRRNVIQTAYEIKVKNNRKPVWNSGKVMADQSVYVPYQGGKLLSGEKYYWQVRVWDNAGKASEWSEVA